MDVLFIRLLNMSITASWFILAILLIRVIGKRIPRKYICLLWALVGIRLMVPFEFESLLSLVPSSNTIKPEIMMEEIPHIESGISTIDGVVNTTLAESAATPEMSANPMQINIFLLSLVWTIGIFIIISVGIFSYCRLKSKIRTAVPLSGKIYQSDVIDTPFVLGFSKPGIYIPFSIKEELDHVIAHEEAHIRRFDHIAKPIAYLVLSIHWFNPLVWISFILLCRDIELACDEKVIKAMTVEERKVYSENLLKCAVKHSVSSVCPLAFGEIGVKDRIYSILHYKKPSRLLIITALIILIGMAVCFMSSPVSYAKGGNDSLDKAVSQALLEEPNLDYEECRGEGHIILGVDETTDLVKVYAITSDGGYSFINGKFVETNGSGAIPTALYFDKDKKGHYKIKGIQYPGNGDGYDKSLKAMFPASIYSKMTSAADKYSELKAQKEAYAAAYLKKIGRTAEIGDYTDFDFKMLDGFSAKVTNALSEQFSQYGDNLGTREFIKDGIRYVRELSTNGKDTITYQTYEYETGKLVEKYIIEVHGEKYDTIVICS